MNQHDMTKQALPDGWKGWGFIRFWLGKVGERCTLAGNRMTGGNEVTAPGYQTTRSLSSIVGSN
jgi:hypothetical protein